MLLQYGQRNAIKGELRKRERSRTIALSPMSTVPLHGVCGYAPGNIAAFSNGNDETFTAKANYDGHFFTGYQWQCVEFARRWLLERKGLVLPEYYIAAHIIYGTKVYRLDGSEVSCTVVRNGTSQEPPLTDSLIIYPSSKKNVVGHIGVIVEVGTDFVRVADQNRFFHHWEGKHYSVEFPLVLREGKYVIVDPEVQPSGWISFPGTPNRPEGVKCVVPESMSAPPKSWLPTHLGFVARQFKEHYWTRSSNRSSTGSCCSTSSVRDGDVRSDRQRTDETKA